jgi:hypothetical protein
VVQIAADDTRLSWLGAVSLERGDGWIRPWRLPHQDLALFHDVLVERAGMPAGVRVAFQTDATEIAGSAQVGAETGSVDVTVNGEILASAAVSAGGEFRLSDLPAGDKAVELWLPQFGDFRLRSLTLSGGGETLRPFEDARPRWITYGSSITQCRAAQSPAYTWPAVVARARRLDLTCLGYGGQCHLDPLVARTIRDLPADFLSMCVGINIYGAASLSPRTFGPGIMAFVRIAREKHPDTPFAVMSPIWSSAREKKPNAVGFTLESMREAVAGAVETLRAHGDSHVHYVDGLTVFNGDLQHLLPDDVHPNAEGYKLMGQNFVREVAGRYFA